MKFSYKYTILAIALFASGIFATQVEEKMESRVEPVTITATLLASALAPMFSNLISGFFGSLFTPNDYQDTVMYGRSMRIKMCGDNCVQITDRASGITVVGTGTSPQEAIGEATQKMFHELLDKKLLSLHDLCYLNIHFAHPDTVNCPGITLDTCSLVQVTTFTQAPCVNKLGDSYCEKNKARCGDHNLQTFMHDNCWKTCTEGKCSISVAPTNPCGARAARNLV